MKIYTTTLLIFLLELRQVRCLCEGLINEIHNESDPLEISNNENCTYNDNLDNFDGLTPLHNAVIKKDMNDVLCILGKGVAVNVADNKGYTPLHYATKYWESEQIVKLLLMSGADVEARGARKRTPIHIATIYNKPEVLRLLLLCHPKSVNAKDYDGMTPLIIAASNILAGTRSFQEEIFQDPIYGPYGIELRFDTSLRIDKYASDSGRYENLIKLLLEHGANTSIAAPGGWTPLHYVAKLPRRFAEYTISLLLEHGAPIEATIASGCTALHIAAQYGEPSTVLLLLQSGAELESIDEDGFTPLLHATLREYEVEEVVKILLEKGADVNVTDRYSYTPLHYATEYGNAGLVRLILDSGTKIDAADLDGRTPLHIASGAGIHAIVRVLLSYEANVTSRDSNGLTPLHYATKLRKIVARYIVNLLLEHEAPIEAKSASGCTALHIAAQYGVPTTVSLLLQKGAEIESIDKNGFTPLLHAVQREEEVEEVVNILLEKGADVNVTDQYSYTPLHYATKYLNADLARLILDSGANVDASDLDGIRPLHLASGAGEEEIVRDLLSYKADASSSDTNGSTPLHYALRAANQEISLESTEKVIKLLLSKGADVNKSDNTGSTPLHLAAEIGDSAIAIHLLNNNANVETKNNEGLTPIVVAESLENIDLLREWLKRDASYVPNEKYASSLLRKAIKAGYDDVAGYLIKNNVDVNFIYQDGSTPLLYATQLGKVDVMTLLLRAGAKVDVVNEGGSTPLHVAASNDDLNSVKILLDFNASINAVDQSNSTSLHLASRLGHHNIVDHLLRQGANTNASNINQRTPVQEAAASLQLEVLKTYVNHHIIGINFISENISDLMKTAICSNKLDVVEALYNVSVTKSSRFRNGLSALHIAVECRNTIALELLLKKGAKVNALDDYNRSALHLATIYNLITAIEILLRYGSDVNAINTFGRTPLHYSVYFGNMETVTLLLMYHADVNIEANLTSDWKFDSEIYTKIMRYMDLLKHLYRNNAKIMNTGKDLSPIALAVWKKDKDLLQLMLDARGKTALNPKEAEWPPLHVACFLGQNEMIKLLIHKGADVNLMDRFGMISLHKAVMAEEIDIVRSIIELNADVDAEGFYGLTPLHVAAKFQHEPILKLLIAKGADVNKEDVAGFTPLLYAEIGGHPLFEKLLVEKSFNLNSTNRYKYLIKVNEIIEDNVLLKYRNAILKNYYRENFKGKFFNHLVLDASYNHEYLEFLLSVKERYDLDYVNSEELKNMTLSKLDLIRKRHHSLLRMLLNMTKDPDKQDKMLGWTALHWAAATGDLASVQLLVDRGASLSLKSMLSQTPMYLARYWGHIDVYRYLKSKGAVW